MRMMDTGFIKEQGGFYGGDDTGLWETPQAPPLTRGITQGRETGQ